MMWITAGRGGRRHRLAAHQDHAHQPHSDVWEQFLRDSEAGVPASAPKEPSARARMATERRPADR
ncbi:hypothetical protein ACFYMR_16895 [Streptomyces albogriseolus]|uniref:hypothetical protein n=1 Tax=Streptomyces albogriseolus TaxID=1887 RepID=UPI0036A9051D